jgi:hypothetical protein
MKRRRRKNDAFFFFFDSSSQVIWRGLESFFFLLLLCRFNLRGFFWKPLKMVAGLCNVGNSITGRKPTRDNWTRLGDLKIFRNYASNTQVTISGNAMFQFERV